jgi:hypothetical protein
MASRMRKLPNLSVGGGEGEKDVRGERTNHQSVYVYDSGCTGVLCAHPELTVPLHKKQPSNRKNIHQIALLYSL